MYSNNNCNGSEKELVCLSVLLLCSAGIWFLVAPVCVLFVICHQSVKYPMTLFVFQSVSLFLLNSDYLYIFLFSILPLSVLVGHSHFFPFLCCVLFFIFSLFFWFLNCYVTRNALDWRSETPWFNLLFFLSWKVMSSGAILFFSLASCPELGTNNEVGSVLCSNT